MTAQTNARIREITTGVTAEMIAEQTHIFYDPSTQSGYVSFQAREHLIVGTDVQAPMGDFDIMQVQLPAIAMQCFCAGVKDPVTGADLAGVSVGGISLLLKAAFDQLYNARDQARREQAAADAAAAQQTADAAVPAS